MWSVNAWMRSVMQTGNRRGCFARAAAILVVTVPIFANPAFCVPASAPSPQPEMVEQRIAELHAESVPARWEATHALGELGADAARAVGPLMNILKNRGEHEYVRGGAAWALGRIGEAAKPAIPLLIDTLTSQHVSVRRNAPRALGNFGEEAKPATAALRQLLDDEDSQVRVQAAAALWKINRQPESLAALETLVLVADSTAAYHAACILGELGVDAVSSAPALAKALGHDDEDVARSAAKALGRFGPSAISAVRQSQASADPRIRRRAVEALGWIGLPALEFVGESLEDEDPLVRRLAARALGRLGPEAVDARPLLLKAVNDQNVEVRSAAAKSLAQIDGAETPAP